MRNFILAVTLLLAVPTYASSLSINQVNGAGMLNWQDDGQVLVLTSDGVDGIHVTTARPDGIFGLHQGDEILEIDGDVVTRIDSLLKRLRASKPDSVKLLVGHGDEQKVVIIAASDYRNILSPPPPPEPPAAPSDS